MFNNLTDQARQVMHVAGEESRQLGHEYLGTEHILLGLLNAESPCATSGCLGRLGLTTDAVRAEVAKLVLRGPTSTQPAERLPLTPRAKRALQFAADEAAGVNLSSVGPEHLLLGLLREGDGVAGVVMRNLGLQVDRVRAESLNVRLRQMRIVERAVRPVRAGALRKRQMREELLAHLTAICQEEEANTNDATAAVDAAAKRFGDPEQLARELQVSLRWNDRAAYRLERWCGRRGPESVARTLSRNVLATAAVMALVVGVPGAMILYWRRDVVYEPGLRLLLAILVLTPLAQFAFGWCYFKTRDAMWGVFGSRKSIASVARWSIAGGLVFGVAGTLLVAALEGPNMRVADTITIMSSTAVFGAIACAVLARHRGTTEIHDTMWARLDLDTSS